MERQFDVGELRKVWAALAVAEDDNAERLRHTAGLIEELPPEILIELMGGDHEPTTSAILYRMELATRRRADAARDLRRKLIAALAVARKG